MKKKLNISLDEKYHLNSDSLSYWISEEVVYSSGNCTERRVSGYHNTFNQAINSFIENYIRSSDIRDYQSLVEEIERLKETVAGWQPVLEKYQIV